MTVNKDTVKASCEPATIRLEPAVHRRILNFLNEAVSVADLEYLKPLFLHDHEGVPIDEHEDQPVRQHRILEQDIAKRIIDFRNLEYPLGLRHLKELFRGDLLNSGVLDTLKHHLGESNYGEWFNFPQSIPHNGPDQVNRDGVIHAALLHTGNVLFVTADQTTLLSES